MRDTVALAAILTCLVASCGDGANPHKFFDFVEVFAGQHKLTDGVGAFGLRTKWLDVVKHRHMDLLTPLGFLTTLSCLRFEGALDCSACRHVAPMRWQALGGAGCFCTPALPAECCWRPRFGQVDLCFSPRHVQASCS